MHVERLSHALFERGQKEHACNTEFLCFHSRRDTHTHRSIRPSSFNFQNPRRERFQGPGSRAAACAGSGTILAERHVGRSSAQRCDVARCVYAYSGPFLPKFP